ncbi:formate dehydrogenase accessory sulfurtransferase FdhD [Marinomonas agarivorans]|nr:formate dehydrogenase accessory sulfurtransferase FdhD [Marinomonas agarivorans]
MTSSLTPPHFYQSTSVTKITNTSSLQKQKSALQQQDTVDYLTIEEPLEIVIEQELLTGLETSSVYVTMRTPGQDIQLAKGFLFNEGFIDSDRDIVAVKHCGPTLPPYQLQNIIKVTLNPTVQWQNKRAQRQVSGNSSCGLCGITSLQAVKMGIKPIQSDLTLQAEQLLQLETQLADHQPLFNQTGGIHAVSLFDRNAKHVITMEDVGRHNAMDKLIGYALEQQLIPLNHHFIITTSRASFELVQKSARAGCALLAAVSAPSSLAVQLAHDINQTLVGFLRNGRLNLYTDQDHRLHQGD